MFILYFRHLNAAQINSRKLALNQGSWGKHPSKGPQGRRDYKVHPCLWAVFACNGHRGTNTYSRHTAAILTYVYTLHDTWMLISPLSFHVCLLSPLRASSPPQPFPPSRFCPTHFLGCTGTLPISHHFPSMEKHPGRSLTLVSSRREKVPPTHLSATTLLGADGPLVLLNPCREHQQQHTK